MSTVDVTIRGAGVFGLAVAWACLRAGARVQVIDPNGIGAGASGGLVGALAPHAPEGWNPLKAFQLEALLGAERFWAEVAEAGGGRPGYLRSGRLQPVTDDKALTLAEERARAAKTLWQGRAGWRLIRAEGAQWAPLSPTGWLVHDDLTARLSPRGALAALAAAIRARGGVILAEGEDRGAVVHAKGAAGLAELSAAFGRKLGGAQKGQAALLRPAVPGAFVAAPQIYATSLHVVPHEDGTVAIGSTSESEWQSEGPDERALALVERARQLVPALVTAELIETWAGFRPRSRTRGPVLGAWPGRAGHFIANGGFKIGFGLAPLVGQRLAELILTGKAEIPEAFRPEALLEA